MTEFVTVFDDVTESCARRAMPEVLAGTGVTVDVSVDNDSGAVQYTVQNTVSASITNLTYDAFPNRGVVVSSDGTDATIPLANDTDAGLIRPLSGDITDVLRGNGTFGPAPLPPVVTTTEDGLIPQLSGNVNHVFLGNGTYGPAPAHVKFVVADEGGNLGTIGTTTKIDFIGAGVAASRVGNTVTVNIPGGGGGGGGLPTNLTYTATPTGGTVLSDTGNDADIPLADVTNAGLLGPLSGDINEVLLGDGTFGPVPAQEEIQFVDHGTNLGTAGTVNRFAVNGSLTFTRTGNTVSLYAPPATPGTDLTYTAAPNNGRVVSNTGTDAIIPLANTINAGLLGPLTGNNDEFLDGNGNFVALPDATTAQAGIAELATNAEVNAGTPGVVVTADQLRNEIDEIAPCSSDPAPQTSVDAMIADPTLLRLTVCENDATPQTMGINGDQLKEILGVTTSSVNHLIPTDDNHWNISALGSIINLTCVIPGTYYVFPEAKPGYESFPLPRYNIIVNANAGDIVRLLANTGGNQSEVQYYNNATGTTHKLSATTGLTFPANSVELVGAYDRVKYYQAYGSTVNMIDDLTATYDPLTQDLSYASVSIYQLAN